MARCPLRAQPHPALSQGALKSNSNIKNNGKSPSNLAGEKMSVGPLPDQQRPKFMSIPFPAC